jgi:hypothetical protein
MNLRRIPIPIDLLEVMPRVHRSMLLMGGHFLNELNCLNKAFCAATNNRPEANTRPIEELAGGLQGMVFARLLAGKLYESWAFVRTQYLADADLVKQISPTLLTDATRALDALAAYYCRKGNGIVLIRNNYSFHDSEKRMNDCWRRSAERHSMEIVLGETISNNLFVGGTVACNMSVFDLYDRDDMGRGMRLFFDELFDILRSTVTWFEGVTIALVQLHSGQDMAALPYTNESIEPPPASEIVLPFFMSKAAMRDEGSLVEPVK